MKDICHENGAWIKWVNWFGLNVIKYVIQLNDTGIFHIIPRLIRYPQLFLFLQIRFQYIIFKEDIDEAPPLGLNFIALVFNLWLPFSLFSSDVERWIVSCEILLGISSGFSSCGFSRFFNLFCEKLFHDTNLAISISLIVNFTHDNWSWIFSFYVHVIPLNQSCCIIFLSSSPSAIFASYNMLRSFFMLTFSILRNSFKHCFSSK